MNMRVGVVTGVLLVAVLGVVAWNNNRDRPRPADSAAGEAPSGETAPEAAPGESQISPPAATDPGLVWTVPKPWLTQIEGSGMRVATYIVPGSAPDSDAECAVYYFGQGAGGGVDLNLERWGGEFASPEKRDLRHREVDGVKISLLAMTGTFAGHTMRTDAAAGPHAHWGLLGAIVEGPRGDVFFKLTGPAATVDAATKPFEAMLASLRKKLS